MRRLFLTLTAMAVLLVGVPSAQARTGSAGGSCGEDPVMTTFGVTFHYKGHSRHSRDLKKVAVVNQCARYMLVEWGRRGSYPDGRGAVNVLVEPHTTATIKSAFLQKHHLVKANWNGSGCCFNESQLSGLTRQIDWVLRADGRLVRFKPTS